MGQPLALGSGSDEEKRRKQRRHKPFPLPAADGGENAIGIVDTAVEKTIFWKRKNWLQSTGKEIIKLQRPRPARSSRCLPRKARWDLGPGSRMAISHEKSEERAEFNPSWEGFILA